MSTNEQDGSITSRRAWTSRRRRWRHWSTGNWDVHWGLNTQGFLIGRRWESRLFLVPLLVLHFILYDSLKADNALLQILRYEGPREGSPPLIAWVTSVMTTELSLYSSIALATCAATSNGAETVRAGGPFDADAAIKRKRVFVRFDAWLAFPALEQVEVPEIATMPHRTFKEESRMIWRSEEPVAKGSGRNSNGKMTNLTRWTSQL